MNRRRPLLLAVLAVLAVLVAPACAAPTPAPPSPRATPSPPAKAAPRSVILFIGDGMAEPQRHAARLFKPLVQGPRGDGVGPPGPSVGRLAMDTLRIHGATDNHSADALVTDSAASATAMATGVRVNNHVIAMGPDKRPVKTILERARDRGLWTGLVTTVTITHATPASFAAHVDDRADESDIALQYLTGGVDVLLGGGHALFLPSGVRGGKRKDGRDLVADFKAKGYTEVEDREALLAATGGRKLLGLFATGAMDYEIDRDPAKQPSLAEMTEAALKILGRSPKGFFLMVEGGKIDWACHDNDLPASIHDTLAFDDAVAAGLRYAKAHPETLVIVTADHETGGLTFPAGFNPAPLVGVKSSVEKVLRSFSARELDPNLPAFVEAVKTRLGITLDVPAKEKLKVAKDARAVLQTLTDLENAQTKVKFTTHAHSALPPVVSAQGPGEALLSGFHDITDVYAAMARVLGVSK